MINVVKIYENFKMTEASAASSTNKPTQEQKKVAVIVPMVYIQKNQGTSASH